MRFTCELLNKYIKSKGYNVKFVGPDDTRLRSTVYLSPTDARIEVCGIDAGTLFISNNLSPDNREVVLLHEAVHIFNGDPTLLRLYLKGDVDEYNMIEIELYTNKFCMDVLMGVTTDTTQEFIRDIELLR